MCRAWFYRKLGLTEAGASEFGLVIQFVFLIFSQSHGLNEGKNGFPVLLKEAKSLLAA